MLRLCVFFYSFLLFLLLSTLFLGWRLVGWRYPLDTSIGFNRIVLFPGSYEVVHCNMTEKSKKLKCIAVKYKMLHLPVNSCSEFPEIRVERQMLDILFLQVSLIKWLQWWAMDTTAIRSMPAPATETSNECSLLCSKAVVVNRPWRSTELWALKDPISSRKLAQWWQWGEWCQLTN
jgi:hypothetical protein